MNSMRLPSFLSSEATPVSPRSPSSFASCSSRLIAAWRPSTMSCVMLPISPPESVLRPLVIPRTNPSEWTLLPTTMLPGVYPFCARAIDLVARKPCHQHRDQSFRRAGTLCSGTSLRRAPKVSAA